MTVCPKCKGYGIVGSAVPDILRGRGHIFSSIECPQCHGSGEVPMTNEEWLKQANTEQLAEWLVDVTQYCFECGLNTNNCVLCPFGKCVDKGFAMEWLKQPHTNS